MPQSLEAYYQQCGRVGRNAQNSECWLIFSDDSTKKTREWLDQDRKAQRWDDVGTVQFFHGSNFPGEEIEVKGARDILREVFQNRETDDGMHVIKPLKNDNGEDSTEKYIAYWLMLGVLTDYETEGIGISTRHRVRLSEATQDFLEEKNIEKFKKKIVASLCNYLSRYRPLRSMEVESEIENQQGVNFSEKIIRYLVSFIYKEIAYQRKEAVRTMWNYCNVEDASSEHLRKIIQAYFDRSEFSDLLEAMANAAPDDSGVRKIGSMIKTVDDIERLYWETRRLLDERYRPDWAALNLYAILYREKSITDTSYATFLEMVNSLRNELRDEENVQAFILVFLFRIKSIDKGSETPVSLELIRRLIVALYREYGSEYLSMIDRLELSGEEARKIHLSISLKQLDNLIYVGKFSRIARRVYR